MVNPRLIKVNEFLDRKQRNGELPLIEIHIIRPVGPTLLNRDFNNSIKKVTFGGAVRVRFSSQSVMKAIRDFRTRITEAENGSNIHSRFLPEHLSQKIAAKGEEYAALADFVREKLTTNNDIKGTTKQLIVYSERDADEIADIIIKKYNKNRDDFLKDDSILNGPDMEGRLKERSTASGVDDMTALKGRMSTELKYVDSIESAASVNHAYSVDEWNGDTDFFAATDDAGSMMLNGIMGGKSDAIGSGMIDDLDIAANVFYQYANIDTRTLLENCLRGVDMDDEGAVDRAVKRMKRIVADFIGDFATILPTAKQHSMASVSEPYCMLVTTKKWARARSADSVFVDVIDRNSKGIAKEARDRLVEFINGAQDGAFATDDYQNILWFEGKKDNGDIPKNAKTSRIKKGDDIAREIFG